MPVRRGLTRTMQCVDVAARESVSRKVQIRMLAGQNDRRREALLAQRAGDRA